MYIAKVKTVVYSINFKAGMMSPVNDFVTDRLFHITNIYTI